MSHTSAPRLPPLSNLLRNDSKISQQDPSQIHSSLHAPNFPSPPHPEQLFEPALLPAPIFSGNLNASNASVSSRESITLRIPKKGKPGRKLNTETAPTKRIEQTREAQRKFRERRQNQMASLEQKVLELSFLLSVSRDEADGLRQRLMDLERENLLLKSNIGQQASAEQNSAVVMDYADDITNVPLGEHSKGNFWGTIG